MDFLHIIEGKKSKDINSQKLKVFTQFVSDRANFYQVFGGCFLFLFFFPPVPLIYSLLTDNTPVIHWISRSTASVFGVPMCLQEGSSATSSPAAAEVISQSAGPATDQDSKGVKSSISSPLVREDLFYHIVFQRFITSFTFLHMPSEENLF